MSNDDRLPNGPDKSEPVDQYATLAAALHGIADNLAGLAGTGLLGHLYMHLNIQPPHDAPDADKVATIDAIGRALVDKTGEQQRMGGGRYHHAAEGWVGGNWGAGVRVAAYSSVTPPEQRTLQDDIDRLTAERDRLTAERDRLRLAAEVEQRDEQRDERPEVES